MSTQPFQSWAMTHPGARRQYNQDTFVNRPDLGLWAVADGAGGHQGGEIAAGLLREALDEIPPLLSASEMLAQVRLKVGGTHDALRDLANKDHQPISGASTIVVLIVRNGHFACLWAGDSRAYLLRDGVLRQVSHDHSLVQELVDAGALRPEDAESHPRANVITRAVGAEVDELLLDKVSDRLQPGDRFLLCSDGLHKTLRESDLAAMLAESTGVPPTQAMIAAAVAMGASDNVTAVVVEIGGAGLSVS
ncbi:PP2C family protein-serine/threonine phosphatase [Rhodopila globiformis]|uniref:Protein phosphatase n=1 Tax=Rhodopila globiformis TaxID=1071 RepID=A0A2S6NKG1_RHOGL|nr:protein phosphatase 2C domain-containing protein [Rhodopila globiformis]PPQ35465.1 protein phosphatase [Rhodopila globiformis]